MIDEIITFKTAKVLKELGFDLPTNYYYFKSQEFLDRGDEDSEIMILNHNKYDGYYSAPTISEVREWYTKTYGVDIFIKGFQESLKKHLTELYAYKKQNRLFKSIE